MTRMFIATHCLSAVFLSTHFVRLNRSTAQSFVSSISQCDCSLLFVLIGGEVVSRLRVYCHVVEFLYYCRLLNAKSFAMRSVIFAASLFAIMGHGCLVIADETPNNEEQPDPATNDEATSSWSLGVGLAVIDYPHYPGSVQNETTIAPIPYVEYHSDRFDLGKDGLAAKVFQSGRLKLDLSVNGALPVSSKKNDLRTGMDDLELMIEFGPELEITLGTWGNSILRLDIPVRANFEVTTDEAPNAVGWSADPRIHFEQNFEHWDWEIDFGALWASQSYQDVFYTVADKDVTAMRPAYQAQSGVLGWRLSATVERRIGDWILFGYLRQMDLSSAANEDSPLLGQNSYLAGGVAAIWMFKTN